MADTNPSALPSSAKAEFPCPDCGEMVREGLVRCWNCGGFLRPEMEQKFQKMQEKPAKVILSETAEPDADDTDLDSMMSERVGSSDGGDDFQLSTTVRQVEAPKVTGTEKTDPDSPPAPEDAAGESPAPTDEAAAPAEGGSEKEGAKPSSAGDENDVPHSVATGGDALLELAAEEEQEREKRQGSRPSSIEGVKPIRDGFLIDAPKGCRIQVRDERTGELRRLTFGASSRVRISMLDKLAAIAKAKKEASEKQPEGPQYLSAGKYQRWMSDVHLHTINPAKLKLVADSLTKEFVPVELGFADNELLIVSLPAGKKSMFGGSKGAATPEEARNALLDHLRAGKKLEGDDVAVRGDAIFHYTADQLAELRTVQPAATLSESLFAGIAVFGEGRIALQLPVREAGEQPKVLSFTLSQFREFVEIVGPLYSLAELGRNLGIPLTDSYKEYKCHYTNDIIKALEHIEFYNADPTLETVIAGYQCGECGIAVSEAAREKEKLGGKGGKGIAKTKCPKCEKKMGHVPLYTLASKAEDPSMQSEDPDTSDSADDASTTDSPPADAKAEAAPDGDKKAPAEKTSTE